jgi:hypothetical protein
MSAGRTVRWKELAGGNGGPRDRKMRGKCYCIQFTCRGRHQAGANGKLATGRQRLFDGGDIGSVAFANEEVAAGIVGKLEFDAVGAVAGAGLRWTYQVHLTDAGEHVCHAFGPLEYDFIKSI